MLIINIGGNLLETYLGLALHGLFRVNTSKLFEYKVLCA